MNGIGDSIKAGNNIADVYFYTKKEIVIDNDSLRITQVRDSLKSSDYANLEINTMNDKAIVSYYSVEQCKTILKVIEYATISLIILTLLNYMVKRRIKKKNHG